MGLFNARGRTCLLGFLFTGILFSNIHFASCAFGETNEQLKLNLDQPYDAGGESAEEEDAPEIITIYGQQYEHDAIFLILDKSLSTKGGELEIEKKELIRTITEFNPRVEFGFTFFGTKVGPTFPLSGRPTQATESQKQAGIATAQAVKAAGVTCPKEALRTIIRMADYAKKLPATIIYISDGATTCNGSGAAAIKYANETLELVAGWNYNLHTINTILAAGDSESEYFPRELANLTHGTFAKISR